MKWEKSPFELLKKKNLHSTEKVTVVAERMEKKTTEKVSQNPEERIENYLNRFSEILDRENEEDRERYKSI